jgi:uncharacterized protein YciI
MWDLSEIVPAGKPALEEGRTMAKFAAMLEFTEDQGLVERTRPTHREYLKSLLVAGKIVMSGPYEDGTGALIVYEAADQNEAEGILRNDPYTKAGVITNGRVTAWRVGMNAYLSE